MTMKGIQFLDLRYEDIYYISLLTASILEQLWTSRIEKNMLGLSFAKLRLALAKLPTSLSSDQLKLPTNF